MSVTIQDQLGDLLIEARQRLAEAEAVNERLRSNILALFRRTRAMGGKCPYCHAPVYWFIDFQNGLKHVNDPDGGNHWANCPKRPPRPAVKEQP